MLTLLPGVKRNRPCLHLLEAAGTAVLPVVEGLFELVGERHDLVGRGVRR